MLGLLPGWVEKAKLFHDMGPCFSAFAGDELIASAGVTLLWGGVAEAWSVITPRVYKHGFAFHRAVKTMLSKIILEKKLYRIQASVISGFPQGAKWLESLGFQCEGFMKKYDSAKNDYFLYAKVGD